MDFKLVVILVALGMVVLFVLQNVAVVEIQFLIWTVSTARSLLIFIVLGIGILLGWFLKSLATKQKK